MFCCWGGCPEVWEPRGAAVLWQSRARGAPRVWGWVSGRVPVSVPAVTRLLSKVTTPPDIPLAVQIPKYFPFQQLSLSRGLVLLARDVFSSVTWPWRGDVGRPRCLHTAPSIPGPGLASSAPSPGGGSFLFLLSRKRSRRKTLPWSDPSDPSHSQPAPGWTFPAPGICLLPGMFIRGSAVFISSPGAGKGLWRLNAGAQGWGGNLAVGAQGCVGGGEDVPCPTGNSG